VAFFRGRTAARGLITLSEPTAADLPSLADDDLRRHIVSWWSRAESSADVMYFVVLERGEPVGEIFLHDIDSPPGEAGVGYYLLRHEHCGHGVGSDALALVVDYVHDQTDLRRLVIQTGSTNVASQRVAERNGFVCFRRQPRPERADGADLVFFERPIAR